MTPEAATSLVVEAMFAGTPIPLGVSGAVSAIAKEALSPPWTITMTGLIRDAQADRVHHGGAEKALHHYPFEHYADWHTERPDLAPRLAHTPAFGENISTIGRTEATVCIGDIYALGSVRLQVSQGRQPCWKLNERFGWSGMARAVQTTGRTGWYYRVLVEGVVEPGTPLVLIERPQPDWPLSRVIALLYRRLESFDELAALSQIPQLAQGWRQLSARRVASRKVEEWSSRLGRGDR